MAESEKPHFPVHPAIAKLKGKADGPLVRFAGYVGESDREGKIRLYLTLSDLSQYLEIEERAIVRTAEAPESLLPEKGLFLWVRANSPVYAVRAREMEASVIAAAIVRNRRRFSNTRVEQRMPGAFGYGM
jgi:hypothetical protein